MRLSDAVLLAAILGICILLANANNPRSRSVTTNGANVRISSRIPDACNARRQRTCRKKGVNEQCHKCCHANRIEYIYSSEPEITGTCVRSYWSIKCKCIEKWYY